MPHNAAGQDAPDVPAVETIRLGVVSFLNTFPLIDGLDGLVDFDLRHSVPSVLIDQLLGDEVDLALCSSIDYQQSPEPLVVVPAGILGCDGPTLTVRLYATRPIHQLQRVHCDTDSHTSVVLMRILLRELFEIDPEIVPYDAREHVAENRPIEWPDAMLLIGDKVVTDSPPAVRYPHQLDLGAAWANATGLPFIFATWMAKRSASSERLTAAAMALDRQRRYNRLHLSRLIHQRAVPRGWPIDLAEKYLGELLAYEWTEERRRGLEQFFDKAAAHGFVQNRRPLEVFALA